MIAYGEIISAPEGSITEFGVYEVGKNNHRLSLKNMLLNPKDSVVLKILIIDFGGHNPPINVTGRIEGIGEFKQEPLVLDDRNPIIKFMFIDKREEKQKEKVA